MMLVKKQLVLKWNLDDAKNDGYLLAGSFPLSLGNEIEFKNIKKNKEPLIFILDNIGIISRSRDISPGELNSITKNSKYINIYNEVKSNSNLNFINEYIGFSTLYSKYKLILGNRYNPNIKKGVIIELYSTSMKNIYILNVKSQNSNEWRKYQTKPLEIKKIISDEENELRKYNKLTEKDLLEKINSKSLTCETIISQIRRYNRNLYIVAYTLQKSKGICEVCNKKSPFKKEDGKDYLEIHHIIPLSEKGYDSIDNVIAVCPNCHRELHFGKNKNIIKEKLLRQKNRKSI